MDQWKALTDIPWPVYLIIAAMGFPGWTQMIFPQMRPSAFTSEDGRELERRIDNISTRVEALPPRDLIADVEVLKSEVGHIRRDMDRIDHRTERMMDVLENHMSVQRSLRKQQQWQFENESAQ